MEEGAILHDLVVRMYHEHARRRAFDPRGAEEAEAVTDDPDLAAGYRDLEAEFTEGKMADMIQQFEAQRVDRTGPGRRVTGLRLGRGTIRG